MGEGEGGISSRGGKNSRHSFILEGDQLEVIHGGTGRLFFFFKTISHKHATNYGWGNGLPRDGSLLVMV